MSWSRELPLAGTLAQLMRVQLRLERLALLQKLRAAETQAASMGVPADKFREIERTLMAMPLGPPDELELPPPTPKPASSDSVEHLAVSTNPRSTF
jgi:hypothetical protein